MGQKKVAISNRNCKKDRGGWQEKDLTILQVDSLEENVFSRSPVEISASNSFYCPPLVCLQLWSQRGQGGAPQLWFLSSSSTNLLARLWVSLSPSGSLQLSSLDSEAQTDNSLRSAKREGKNGLSQGDGVADGNRVRIWVSELTLWRLSTCHRLPPRLGCRTVFHCPWGT